MELLSFLLYFYFLIRIWAEIGHGRPELECLGTGIRVRFNTSQEFEGRIFVKGFSASSQCVSSGSQLSLSFSSCGIARTRVLNPRGLRIETTLILASHPIFITKSDKAYRFDCFYTEKHMHVRYDLEVDELTTIPIHLDAKMPTCQYEILSSPKGEPVRRVEIGDTIYHRWKCTDYEAQFCIQVHSCFIESDDGQRAMIIDSRGCSTDIGILQQLSYLNDMEVGQSAQVCSFADRSQIYFQCQISVIPRGSSCERPSCTKEAGKIGIEGKSRTATPPDSPPILSTKKTTPTPRQTVYLKVKPRQTISPTSTKDPIIVESLVDMVASYDIGNSIDGSGFQDFPTPPTKIEQKREDDEDEEFSIAADLLGNPEWGTRKRRHLGEAVMDVRTGIQVDPLDPIMNKEPDEPSEDLDLCLSPTTGTSILFIFISLAFLNILTIISLYRQSILK